MQDEVKGGQRDKEVRADWPRMDVGVTLWIRIEILAMFSHEL